MDSLPNEIVIVRRRYAWDDDHLPHGVWKIAYADFMTALMAFFLVMWLINVTDESVRRGVAQYFNPVKLASTAPNRKGLNDPIVNGDTNENGTKLFTGKLGGSDLPSDQDDLFGDGREDGQKPAEPLEFQEQGGAPAPAGEFRPSQAESILFTDPYAVLDTLARKINVARSGETNPDGIGSGLEKQQGARGGEAYRDPFDPQFWQFRPGRGVDGAAAVTAGLPSDIGQGPAIADAGMLEERVKTTNAAVGLDGESASREPGTDIGAGSGPSAFTAAGDAAERDTGQVVAHVSAKPGLDDLSGLGEGEEDGADKLVADLTTVLAQAEGTLLENTAAQISVARHEDGALISLTDDQSFGMFAIGSAEPRPELVKLLERLGSVIARSDGQIVVTGHTDARPFKSTTYDNWRLSSARAHMALYMLNRGGVGTDRFIRIEGAADRHLKIPDDPFAAANRRVEIYLLEGSAE